MFCSDDKHPDDLIKGHINEMVKRAARLGIDHMKLLRAACVNPVLHYGLNSGILQIGDSADFLVVDNLKDFTVLKTIRRGEIVAESGTAVIPRSDVRTVNRFHAEKKRPEEFLSPAGGEYIRVIEAIDGQVITGALIEAAAIKEGNAVSSPERNIHKIVVVNRYHDTSLQIDQTPAASLSAAALSVFSHGNWTSSRPKWP